VSARRALLPGRFPLARLEFFGKLAVQGSGAGLQPDVSTLGTQRIVVTASHSMGSYYEYQQGIRSVQLKGVAQQQAAGGVLLAWSASEVGPGQATPAATLHPPFI
jgi:hypothetical protein